MKYKPLPTKKELHKLFEYRDGQLWWRERGRRRQLNKPAGWLRKDGYVSIFIKGYSGILAHRAIYVMFVCDPGNLGIDHINGNVSDNRIENLRAVTALVNQQNQRKPHSRNSSGFLGVTYRKDLNKYVARIRFDGKRKNIGLFKTAEEAHKAYIDEKRKHHEGCTI